MSKYRGIVFDIDETIVPNGASSVTSKPLINAFANLPNNVITIAATGRMKSSAFPIIGSLKLKHNTVVANGAQIINSSSGRTIYSRNLSVEQVNSVLKICEPYNYKIIIPSNSKKYMHSYTLKPITASALFVHNVIKTDAHYLAKIINKISGVHAYIAPAWSDPANFDIGIGHAKAKKHVAIEILYKKYNLKPEEVIGVGDGINDIELFNAVGHKIAVANANPKLLEIADEIVPSQKDNGIITVLNKYFS